MWPGLLKSLAAVAGHESSLIVRALSSAEMPVVTPSRASTVIVKAVFMASSFSLLSTIRGRSSSSSLFLGIETQIRPLVWFTMKAICSGVTCNIASLMKIQNTQNCETKAQATIVTFCSGMTSLKTFCMFMSSVH